MSTRNDAITFGVTAIGSAVLGVLFTGLACAKDKDRIVIANANLETCLDELEEAETSFRACRIHTAELQTAAQKLENARNALTRQLYDMQENVRDLLSEIDELEISEELRSLLLNRLSWIAGLP